MSCFNFSTSYGVLLAGIFNVGLGRVCPKALLSNAIHSSLLPFCSDKLAMEVSMMMNTTVI